MTRENGDLISRQAVLDCLTATGLKYIILDVRNKINSLPPVKPQQKIGHWIPYKNEADVYKCTACEAIVYEYPTSWDYCPWCGVRMIKPQESEEK